jgi:hypothetical protein
MMLSIAASTSRTLARRATAISPRPACNLSATAMLSITLCPCTQAMPAMATKAAAAKHITSRNRPAMESEPKIITIPYIKHMHLTLRTPTV